MRRRSVPLSVACAVLAVACRGAVGIAAALGGGAGTAEFSARRDRTDTRLANAMPACRTSQLKITMGHSFAGLGTAGASIRFINHSTLSCELHGWPTLIAETSPPGSARAHAL